MASSSAVTLTAAGFIYNGCEHAYEQVTSLYFYHQVTRVTVAVFHPGDEHRADLDIYAQGCPAPIKIRTGVSIGALFDVLDRKSECRANSVIQLYEALAKRTFRFRLQRYLDMIDKNGYFFYDNKQIFADGRASDGKRWINFHTSSPLYRKPFTVYYETQKTLAEQLVNPWKPQDFIISTRHDADVFFFLMKRLFGLSWK